LYIFLYEDHKKQDRTEPGHEISESLFETGALDVDAESVIMDIVCSTRALSQPLDLSG
jgi:hypothetical protein